MATSASQTARRRPAAAKHQSATDERAAECAAHARFESYPAGAGTVRQRTKPAVATATATVPPPAASDAAGTSEKSASTAAGSPTEHGQTDNTAATAATSRN